MSPDISATGVSASRLVMSSFRVAWRNAMLPMVTVFGSAPGEYISILSSKMKNLIFDPEIV